MIRTSTISVLATSVVLIAATPGFAPPVFAQGTFQSSANGNWNSAGTWTLVSGSDADGIPDADDAVEITAGTTVTLTANAASASLTFLGTGASANLTHNSGISLTVGGAVTINGSTSNGTKAWNIDAGSAAVNGNVTLNQGTNNNRIARINITTGSLDINGDLVFNGGNAVRKVIDMSGGTGTINLSGNFTVSTNGTLTSGTTSTFIYDGAGAQTVGAGSSISYANLTINAGSVASVGNTLDAGGTTSIWGELQFGSTTGTKTLNDIMVNSGGVWNVTVNEPFLVNGNIQNGGTFTAGLGGAGNVYTLAGAGKTISGSNPISIDRLTVNGTYTNLGSLSVATVLSGSGTLTNGASAALNIGTTAANFTLGTLAASAAGNTVDYDRAGAQTVRSLNYYNLTLGNSGTKTFASGTTAVAGALTISGSATADATTNSTTVDYNGSGAQTATVITYYHLTASGGGTKTAGGAFTVQGNLNISGVTLADGGNTLTVNGNLSNSASHTGAGNILLSGGSVAHTLSGGGSFTNLELDDVNGATVSSDATMNGAFTLTSGTVTTGANTIIISSTGSVARTSGHVVGNLQKYVATGAASQTFEVGDASNYTPVGVSFGNVSTAGNLTASTTAGDHPDIANSGIAAAKSVNRYWTFVNSGILFDNYSATLNFVAGDVDPGASTAAFIVGKDDAGTWTRPSVGTRTATSTQATGMTSFSDFQVGEAGPTRLAITSVNGGTNPIAGTAFNVVVESQDDGGSPQNVSANTNVQLSLNTGTGTLGGTLTGLIFAGSSTVTITGVTYTKAESGVILTASRLSGDNLAAGNSAPFTVDPGAVASLRVTGTGTMTAGSTNELTVTAFDALDNLVGSGPNNYTGAKTLTFSGPGISPDGNTPTMEGVNVGTSQSATFTNGVSNANALTLIAYNAETTTVDVTDGAVDSFGNPLYDLDLTVNAGSADHLALTGPGSTPVAGISFDFASLVSHDRYGNAATGYGGSHTISYSQSGVPNGPESGIDIYTNSVDFTSGTATTTLSTTLYRSQASITVTANAADDAGLIPNHATAAFDIDPGTAVTLRVTGAGTMTAGTSNELTVSAKDSFGNSVSFGPNNYAGSKTLTFSGPGNAPAGNIPTVEGVDVGTPQSVTFTNGVSNAGAATLVAYRDESTTVDVTDGTIGSFGNPSYDLDLLVNSASVDHFVIGPISTPQTAGSSFGIDITAEDLYDNIATSFTGTANLLTTAGTVSPSASGSFTAGLRAESVSVTQAGTGRTVSVDDGSGHTGTSNTFDVNPGALDHFGISTISSPQTAGSAFSIIMTAEDVNDNTVTSFSGTVALATTAGVISPAVSASFIGGVRTESVTVTLAGGGMTISVDDGSSHTGVSNSFTVSVGPAYTIILTSGDGQSGVVSSLLSTPMTVTVADAGGNPVIGTDVAFAIVAAPAGAGGQSLSITNSVTNLSGESSTTLTLGDKSGTYTVEATSIGLVGSPVTFTATAASGGPTSIALASGDGQSAMVSTALPLPLTVVVEDGSANPVAGVGVTFSISSAPAGASGQSLSVTNATTDISGKASTVLTLGNKVGTYTVEGVSGGLTGSPVTFMSTAVVGAADHLVFVTQPSGGFGGSPLSIQPRLEIRDAGDNQVSTAADSVSVSISANPGGGTLGGTTTVAAVNGVASFTDLRIDKAGSGYTLVASSPGLGSSTSAPFNVAVGAAAALSLASGDNQTGPINSQLPAPFVALVTDLGGNPVSGAGVDFVITSVPTGATGQTLSASNVTTDASGLAATILTLGDKTGTYIVTASSGTLSGSPVLFQANAGTGSAAALSLKSGNDQIASINSTLTDPLTVVVSDQGGNPVAGVGIDFAIISAPAGASGQQLSAATVTTGANGEASTLLTLGSKVGDYTVVAASTGLTGSPVTFTASALPGAAVSLVFTQQPGNAVGGSLLGIQPILEIRDPGDNRVTTSSASVSVVIDSNPSGGTVSGTTTVDAVNGVAEFSDLKIDKVGNGYTLAAFSTQLISATSQPFDVVAGPALSIALESGNDQTAMVGMDLQNPFVVRVTDAGANPVSGVSVKFEIVSAPAGASGQQLSFVDATTNASGLAASILTLGSSPSVYTVTASSADLSGSPVTFIATGREPDGTGVATVDPQIALVSVETSEAITIVGDGQATIASVSVTIPSQWGWSGSLTDVVLSGTGFVGSATVSGDGSSSNPYTVTVTNASVTVDDPGVLTVTKLLPPSSLGLYEFTVRTASVGGTLTSIETSPSVEVHQLVIGDANLDASVNILDMLHIIDAILGRVTLTPAEAVVADVYPAHASPDLQGPPDGDVDVSDLVLIQNAILNGVWDDGTPLGAGNGSTSSPGAALSTSLLESSNVAPRLSSDEVLITFEVYDDFMAVRLTNSVPVKGLQLNLMLTQRVPTPFETEEFSRVDFMNVLSKVVDIRHTVLLFNLENRPIDPGDSYILFIKGDWSAYNIPETVIIAGIQLGTSAQVTYRWVKGQVIPRTYKLEQNYPNPFNPSTTIQFQLPEFVKVKVAVFNILGQHIRTLLNEEMDPGVHTLIWDGKDDWGQRMASGTYLLRVRAGDFIGTKKMVLVK